MLRSGCRDGGSEQEGRRGCGFVDGGLWFERILTVNGQFELALDSEKAKETRTRNINMDTCSVCGELR